MSRTQAEITARAIDQQVSLSKQEFLDRMDARFDAIEKRFEDRFDMVDARFDAVNNRIDAVEKRFEDRFDMVDARIDVVEKRFEDRFDIVEKRLSWLTVEHLIAISVIGVGFVGVILALLRLN